MLNGKNRFWLLISLLVFFVILLVIFFALNATSSLIFYIIFVIGISNVIAAIIFTIIYNKKTKKRIQGLSKPYQEMYIQSQNIINSSLTNKKERKVNIEMILEIFEHACLANRDINDVVNNDIHKYIEGFILESKFKFNLYYMLTYCLFLYIVFLLSMKTYKLFRESSFSLDNFQSYPLDVGIVLTYTIISFVFFPLLLLIINGIAKKKLQGYKKIVIIIPTLIPIGLSIILIFVNNENFKSFLDQPINIFPNLFAYILGFLLAAALLVLMKFTNISKIK
ncbi:MAG: DUF1048 domain-containing protein [Bacillota bacterium]